MSKKNSVTLKSDPKNARKHSERNKKLIRQSLESVGAGRSILVDAKNIVRAGNGVYEQARELGIPVRVIETNGKELIAVKRTDLKGKDAIRAAALDNIVSDSSAHDYDAEILAEIANDDELIAALVKEDNQLAALLAQTNEREKMPTMSKGYFDEGETNANYKKLCYRVEAMGKAANGLAIEMFAGKGQLSFWYNRNFRKVVTIDKHDYDGVDFVMPCEKFIDSHLKEFSKFDLVDFDDEGSPALAIRKFFDAIRPKPRKFVLCFTDGILNTLKVRGPWTPQNYFVESVRKKAVAADANDCERIIQNFIERVAAPQFKIEWLGLERNATQSAVYGTCLVLPV